MNNFSIGSRINALAVMLLLLLSVVGGVGYSAVSKLITTFDEFAQRDSQAAVDLMKAERDFVDLRRNVFVYSVDPADRTAERVAELNREVARDVAEVAALTTVQETKVALTELSAELKEYAKDVDELLALGRGTGGKGDARLDSMLRQKLDPLALTLGQTFGKISAQELVRVEAVEKAAREKAVFAERELIAIIVVSAVLGLFVAFVIGRGIVRPVQGMTKAMTRIAGGDGTVEVPGLGGRDEIAAMASAVNIFKQNADKIYAMTKAEAVTKEIGDLIARAASGDYTQRVRLDDKSGFLRDIGDQVNHLLESASQAFKDFGQKARQTAVSVGEASTAVSQVSDGARSQMSSLAQVASALTDSAKAIRIVSDSTKNASDKAIAASQFVKRGQTAVDQLIPIVEAIAQNSRKIDQITQVIGQIANRTHILSLNAAIEAARAGEHGKGFVVVAQEVGKLAESAGQNAKQIADIVERASSDAQEGKTATVSVRDV
ncbi:MAG: HAMP domain-containing protein, partial [Vicinamibacteria bacterium]|nr:HAMP domain-containing protein [Vicinamibacteria bacterium]